MAWYIMLKAESQPPGKRARGSRHWLGPMKTKQDAEELYEQLLRDGHKMTGLIVEEDESVK